MRRKVDPDVLSIALAEPSRRALLENLRFGQKSVTELVNATQLKQPNVSNHLAKMRQQGIVRAERIGRQVYYSLSTPFADVLLRMHEFASNPTAVGMNEPTSPPVFAPPAAVRGAMPGGASPIAPQNGRPAPAELSDASRQVSLGEWRNTYFQNILGGKEDQAMHLVNAMLAHGLDLETIYMEVFQWAMNRIGELYQQGATDEAHEHMASAITERMMSRVAQFHIPVGRPHHRAVLGCVAGNWHVMGVRMLADGLRRLGWETLFLGANVPVSSFVSMVRLMRPDLVVISCSTEEQLSELRDLIAQLRTLRLQTSHSFAIAVGGHYLLTHTGLLPDLHADLSAPDLSHFLELIRDRYSPPAQS
jgi:methanogenic corrinoid protein MtbC1/DNA-binding transcriptional ArsR family regulator